VDGHDSPMWVSIDVGYQREDGKRLHLTASKKQPSWVSERWCKRMSKVKSAKDNV
jgi:hypothetical protein